MLRWYDVRDDEHRNVTLQTSTIDINKQIQTVQQVHCRQYHTYSANPSPGKGKLSLRFIHKTFIHYIMFTDEELEIVISNRQKTCELAEQYATLICPKPYDQLSCKISFSRGFSFGGENYKFVINLPFPVNQFAFCLKSLWTWISLWILKVNCLQWRYASAFVPSVAFPTDRTSFPY